MRKAKTYFDRLMQNKEFRKRFEEEETRFWETHSPLDYSEEFTELGKPLEFSSALLRKVAKRRQERRRRKESKRSRG